MAEGEKKSDCVFCKIVDGSIPAYKFWENDDVVAFLDINPKVKGQALVIPKSHNEHIFDMPDVAYQKLMSSVKFVATILKKHLSTERVCLVVEGFEVPHVHAKLFPVSTVEEFNLPQKRGNKDELAQVQEELLNLFK